MTLSTTNLKDQYFGDSVSDTFQITFQFLNANEILVVILDTDGVTEISRTLGSHYNVAGGNGSTGSITFTAGNIPIGNGMAGSQLITIMRNMAFTQSTDLTPNDPLPADLIERSFGDRVMMLLQQMQEGVGRSIKLFSSANSNAPEMVQPVGNTTLVMSADASQIIPGPTVDQVSNAQGYSIAAAASAAQAAASVAALTATSATSLTIGTGNKTFVTQAGKLFVTGQQIIAASAANPANLMQGSVLSYVDTNLVLSVTNTGGSGTKNDWIINISGTRGATGATGPAGPGSGDMVAANNLNDVANPNTARTNIAAAKSGDNTDITQMLGLIVPLALPANFRLSLTSALAVTTADVVGATTLRCVPYLGDLLSLNDGAKWVTHRYAEFSLALSGLTSGRLYDVFAYDNAGVATLELSAPWTNITTRANALALLNGIEVKSGAITRRYMGTILATGTNTAEDSATNRFVWNRYNKQKRLLQKLSTTPSWSDTLNSFHQANYDANNQVNFIVGLIEDSATIKLNQRVSNNIVSSIPESGIGFNSTTSPYAGAYESLVISVAGGYMMAKPAAELYPTLGKNYFAWLEKSASAGVTLWEGQSTYGLQGWILG